MNIVGKTKIFKNEYNGNVFYTTSISSKNREGKYEYMTVDVQLPKGTELENKTDIDITNGFLSFYKTKNGLSKIKYVVMDFVLEETQQNDYIPPMDDSDLPF